MIATFDNEYGKPVINYYGSNEGISLFSTPDTATEANVRASMFPRFGAQGMPFSGITHDSVRSKVIDPDSGADILEPGVPGELCFVGATVFDGYLGEKICACVVPLADGEAPTLEEICAYLSQRGIARFKLPERVEIMAVLPRNPMNKVVRSSLQEAIA